MFSKVDNTSSPHLQCDKIGRLRNVTIRMIRLISQLESMTKTLQKYDFAKKKILITTILSWTKKRTWSLHLSRLANVGLRVSQMNPRKVKSKKIRECQAPKNSWSRRNWIFIHSQHLQSMKGLRRISMLYLTQKSTSMNPKHSNYRIKSNSNLNRLQSKQVI